MNRTEIFNYIFESFGKQGLEYVILHSYQKLPNQFDSDIDTAVVVNRIEDAIHTLDSVLSGTGWRVIQYWRHENYAADCVISNNFEFLQVDFCTHYERNGRVVMPVQELVAARRAYKNFYIPNPIVEFTYILLKKVLKKNFSEGSKEHLVSLLAVIKNEHGEDELVKSLKRFLSENEIDQTIEFLENEAFDSVNLEKLHKSLLSNTSSFVADLHYKFFDIKRKIERIIHPTGMFIVLLGVDGAGKTTIATKLKEQYVTAFRKINHYHSRVRVLKDISQIKKDAPPIDASNPHSKKKQANKLVSIVKFGYYYLDFLIGNIIISVSKIKSSLVLIERYYYDYSIDKIRYNLNLSNRFLNFFGIFILKPDAIFILTGDSQQLLERKHEISIQEIDEQKQKLEKMFRNNPKAVFIDTTEASVDECVAEMLERCNDIMRGRRKW